MLNLKIIVASTRPGRQGPVIAEWVNETVKQHGGFDIEVLDLAVVNLPMMDEPHHPRMQMYTQEHTKQWSKTIDPADAFIIVTPEYNHGYPAPLKNALDHLYKEWNYKPVGFVSYGGLSGGTRSVQQLIQVVTAQKMVPLVEAVNIPFFSKHITDEENFMSNDVLDKSAKAMLNELTRWAEVLKPMRNK